MFRTLWQASSALSSAYSDVASGIGASADIDVVNAKISEYNEAASGLSL